MIRCTLVLACAHSLLSAIDGVLPGAVVDKNAVFQLTIKVVYAMVFLCSHFKFALVASTNEPPRSSKWDTVASPILLVVLSSQPQHLLCYKYGTLAWRRSRCGHGLPAGALQLFSCCRTRWPSLLLLLVSRLHLIHKQHTMAR